MRCEECGGRMIVRDTAADIYITYRKRECDKCGRIIFTQEDEDDLAEYFLRTIRREHQIASEKRRGGEKQNDRRNKHNDNDT